MKRVTAYALSAFALSLCLTGLTGCVNPAWSPTEPTIASFTANPTAVTAGGTASLTGVFTNGTGVITPGNLPVTSGTAVTVTPSQTTTYILTVTNASGGTTALTATVTVTPAAPTIASFAASPTTVTAGGTASLTGVFANGTGAITPGNIAATSGTAITVTPTDTTTYTLTVTNSAGVIAAQAVTVTVNVAAPAITSFAANPSSITAGGTSSLTGVFSGGKGVITPGNIAATSGTAVSVTPSDTTIYTLTVTNSAGATATQAATVTVAAASAPAAPTGLTATPGNASVTLSWTASAGATSYNVYRGTTQGGESATPIATGITTTGYADTGLTNGQPYYYEVAAVNGVGTSPMSNEASATPTASACVVTLVAKDTGVAEIDLSWNPCPGATSYNILRSTASGGPYTTLTVSTGTAYQDFGLVRMQTYYYLVESVNSSGMNVESNEANAVFTSKYVSQDANGWTTVIPSPNGRQYYVSSSNGSDSNPGTQAKPFATIKKAAKLVRPGYPDWILLKDGDVWYDDFGDFQPIGGLSADEPMVFTSYSAGPRPQMRFVDGGDNVCFGHFSGHTFSHFYFIGLECYDSRKDPSSPDYESSNGKATASDTTAWGEVDNGDDILVEDNYFHFTAGGIDAQLDTGPAPKNIRIRRNVITDIYSAHQTNPQGFFLANITNLLVEDNLFDHNAWNDQAGDIASVFDHHMYVVDSYMTTIRNNLMLRDESLSLKLCSYAGQNDAFAGALVYNNLIFEGEVGISIGYGASAVLTGSAFTGFKVDNNILLQVDRDNPTKRGLGWGIDIQNVSESYFTNNIFSQFDTLPGGNTYAFDIDLAKPGMVASGITIQSNLIYQDAGDAFILDEIPTFTNIKIQNNTIQNTGLPTQSQVNYDPLMYLETDNSLAPYSFSGNTYYNAGPYNGDNSNIGFAFVDTGNVLDIYNQWLARSGETGSQIKQIAYLDPNRTLESYDVTLGGMSSLNPVFAAIRSQSRASWNPAYTAEAVNDYIRNGFSVAPLGGGVGNSATPPAPVTTLSAAPGNNSVSLNWTTPNGSPTFYIVYRGSTAGGENMVSPVATYVTGTSWTDATVVNGTTYYYQVASMNAGGFGGLSNEVSAEPTVNAGLTAQTITFNQPAAQTVGTPLTLSATATSGLAVSFASTTTNVCTVSGTTATFLTAGTCTITATQAGNSTYAAATPVSQSFTVNGTIPAAPTGLTATPGNASITLSWTASAGATSYNVYRGTTSGGESATPIATGITTTGYTDTGLTNGQEYFYEVAAVNSAGTSPKSNEASATPKASSGNVTITANKLAYPFQVLSGSTRQINVQITGGTLNTVNWSVLSATGGATATFTTPAASGASTVSAGLATVQVNIGPTAGNCSISGSMGSYSISSPVAVTVQAQSVDDTTKSATFLFNVCAKTTTVMVAPAYQQAFKSQHRMLQSWISGDTDETGTWSIATQPSGGDGTLADTANRDADFVATVTGRYTLRYTSNSNPAKSATAIVYVSPNALPSYASTPNFTEPRECYVDPALTGGDYEVGAGKKYTTVSSVPAIDTWTPGTIMRIWNTDATGSNPSTYHEYFQIQNGGTPAQPVIVCGAPDSYGNLPILDGKNAVGQSGISTGAAAGYGIMSVWAGPPTPYGYWQSGSAGPSYVSITGLHLRNATPGNTYTPPGGGTAEAYVDGASCVNLRSGSYIDVGGNDMDTCTNGLFTAENGNSEWANITQLVTVTGNHIHQSGWSTDYSEHQVYFQTWYGLMQGNKIDNYLSTAQGSNIKWRGVEGIFRYNDIASGPLRDFDLVENQDAPQYVTFEDYLGAPGDTVCDDSAYCLGDTAGANIIAAYQESAQKDFIYGNLIFGTSAEDQIHYAEDNTGGMSARNGTLYFYSNTLDNAQKIFDTGENGDGYNPILQPRVDARNNILWARNVAWSGVVQMEFGSDATIILDATTNLMQAGTFTIAIPIEGAVWQDGTQEGWPSTCDSTPCFWPLTVPLNTHLYGLSNANYLTASTLPYDAATLVPITGSAAVEAGTALSGLLATMPVRWQYSMATNSLTPRLEPLTVGAED